MKEAVDQELLEEDPEWLSKKTYLSHPDFVKSFMTRAREFIKDGNVSTLLSKSVKVFVNSVALPAAVNLLQEHGKWIRKLQFTLFEIELNADPRYWIPCLNLDPALELLELEVVVGWDNDDEDNQPLPTHFPQLKSLNQMIVSVEHVVDDDAIPPKKFFNPFLQLMALNFLS